MRMRIRSFLQFVYLLTAVEAHDPFSYNQVFNVNLDAPEESMDTTSSDLEFSVSSLALMGSNDIVGDFNAFLQQKHDNEGDGDDDDDDNQDDDDGSCSMLSNESLSRNQEPVVTTTYICKDENPHIRISSHRPGSSPISAALRLRGGGGGAPGVTTDVLRKLVVVALVTLVYEGMIGHLLEFLKIIMQTAPQGVTYVDIVRDITSAKGIAGLWDGFCPWGIVQAIFKGAIFGLAHATASNLLLPLVDQGKLSLPLAMALAGGIGGGFQGYALSPTLLLKTRVMTDPVFRQKMSLFRTAWLSFCIGFDVVQREGILVLMKGANTFAVKRVFDWSTRFYFSDLFETILLESKGVSRLTTAEKSLASFLGGALSTLSTLPLDVIVAKTQDAKNAGVKVSPWTLFRTELKEKGWTGVRKTYTKGFFARLLHVCTTTVGKYLSNVISFTKEGIASHFFFLVRSLFSTGIDSHQDWHTDCL